MEIQVDSSGRVNRQYQPYQDEQELSRHWIIWQPYTPYSEGLYSANPHGGRDQWGVPMAESVPHMIRRVENQAKQTTGDYFKPIRTVVNGQQYYLGSKGYANARQFNPRLPGWHGNW